MFPGERSIEDLLTPRFRALPRAPPEPVQRYVAFKRSVHMVCACLLSLSIIIYLRYLPSSIKSLITSGIGWVGDLRSVLEFVEQSKLNQTVSKVGSLLGTSGYFSRLVDLDLLASAYRLLLKLTFSLRCLRLLTAIAALCLTILFLRRKPTDNYWAPTYKLWGYQVGICIPTSGSKSN